MKAKKTGSSLIGSTVNIYVGGIGLPSILWKVASEDEGKTNKLYAVGSVCVIDIEGLRLKFR